MKIEIMILRLHILKTECSGTGTSPTLLWDECCSKLFARHCFTSITSYLLSTGSALQTIRPSLLFTSSICASRHKLLPRNPSFLVLPKIFTSLVLHITIKGHIVTYYQEQVGWGNWLLPTHPKYLLELYFNFNTEKLDFTKALCVKKFFLQKAMIHFYLGLDKLLLAGWLLLITIYNADLTKLNS